MLFGFSSVWKILAFVIPQLRLSLSEVKKEPRHCEFHGAGHPRLYLTSQRFRLPNGSLGRNLLPIGMCYVKP